MSRKRIAVVYMLLAFLLTGHLVDVLLSREHWPFSNYPMFAYAAGQQMTFFECCGVIDDGRGRAREMMIDPHWAPGLPLYKIESRLSRATAEGADPLVLKGMLDDYLSTYNAMRLAGLNSGPPLSAIRIYRVILPLQLPLVSLTANGPQSQLVRRALIEIDQHQVPHRPGLTEQRRPEDRS